jgi:hypothetical protein
MKKTPIARFASCAFPGAVSCAAPCRRTAGCEKAAACASTSSSCSKRSRRSRLHCSGPGTALITWLSHKDLQALLCSPLAQAGVVGCYVLFVLVSMAARKAARRIRRRETHPQPDAAREPEAVNR